MGGRGRGASRSLGLLASVLLLGVVEGDELPRLLSAGAAPGLPLFYRVGLSDQTGIAKASLQLFPQAELSASDVLSPTFGALATLGEAGSRYSEVLGLGPGANDVVVAMATTGAALLWLRFWQTLAAKGVLDPKISRKIIHCGSAPLFLALWPLYSDSQMARIFAAAVPLVQIAKLVQAGLSGVRDEREGDGPSTNTLVKAISRTGKAKEALGGPLIYTIVLAAATILQWRGSPVGIIAVAQMAAGDGLADIVGRKYGKSSQWSFVPDKSVAGSVAFVAGGFLVSSLLLWWFIQSGCILLPSSPTNGAGGCALKLLAISIGAAAVELIPIADDNITVPLASALLTALLFGCM
mmetsp:Transcript_188/g.798  ORF Transcript_188/g.798 Transcript_188/m.798 type:complete len:352 (+) Transcript_188:79-1134(+)|eukprot:scaffold1596_cov302-Pinguiococcus_pyrenoidosus.AAC.75